MSLPSQVKRGRGKQNIPWRGRSARVTAWKWKRTQYFQGTASVWIKGLERRGERRRKPVPEGLYARRAGRASEGPHEGQTWPDLHYGIINHSGRNWWEASLEQEAGRRLRVKSQIEQQQQKEMGEGLVEVFRNGTRQHILLTGWKFLSLWRNSSFAFDKCKNKALVEKENIPK